MQLVLHDSVHKNITQRRWRRRHGNFYLISYSPEEFIQFFTSLISLPVVYTIPSYLTVFKIIIKHPSNPVIQDQEIDKWTNLNKYFQLAALFKLSNLPTVTNFKL